MPHFKCSSLLMEPLFALMEDAIFCPVAEPELVFAFRGQRLESLRRHI